MVYLLIGAAAVFLGSVYIFTKTSTDDTTRNSKLLRELSKRQDMIESLVLECEKKHKDLDSHIDAIASSASLSSSGLHNLRLEHERLAKEYEFMRAHQHGMDKRIAGLKREVIVTINEAVKKTEPRKPTVTKSLLKRAGVTQ